MEKVPEVAEAEAKEAAVVPRFGVLYRIFARETSAHGFRWTVEAGSVFRVVLWSFLVLVAIVASLFSVFTVTDDYVKGKANPFYSVLCVMKKAFFCVQGPVSRPSTTWSPPPGRGSEA